MIASAADSAAWILALSGLWFAIGLLSGFAAHRLPMSLLQRDTWITRERSFERGGRFYSRRLRIDRWKQLLPEAGATFRGGFSKRHLQGRSDAHLLRFSAETRRAEYVHWANAGAGPLFFIVLPIWGGVVMTAFGLIVHLPFVCIQRYNRARLTRTLARRGVAPGSAVTPLVAQ